MNNSSYSLSIPSEPPDIRNWFPSYQYETFVLDTYDADACGGSSAIRESDCETGGEKEGILGDSGINCDCDDDGDKEKDHISSRMPDSENCLSLISEPPHIGNWFSSYAYESPALDTVAKESECEKEGFRSEESQRKKERDLDGSKSSWNCNDVEAGGEKLCANRLVKCVNSIEETSVCKPSSEIPDSSQSSSILSEPRDIRNWFFSYVYESPEINEFVDIETRHEEDDFTNQQDNKVKGRNFCNSGRIKITDEVVVDEKLRLSGLSKFTRSIRDEEDKQSLDKGYNALDSETSCNQDNLSCERGSNLENKAATNHHISSARDPEKASLNSESLRCKQQQKQYCLQEADSALRKSSTNSSINNEMSSTKLIRGEVLAGKLETTETNISSPVARDLMRNPTCGSNEKENEGKVARDGFVTTKNRVRNDENSLPKSQKILSECSRKKRETSSNRNDALKRKVLSERTNLEVEHTNVIEFTGKWRCPQKSKPNTGPPMKQVRLERWIHKL